MIILASHMEHTIQTTGRDKVLENAIHAASTFPQSTPPLGMPWELTPGMTKLLEQRST